MLGYTHSELLYSSGRKSWTNHLFCLWRLLTGGSSTVLSYQPNPKEVNPSTEVKGPNTRDSLFCFFVTLTVSIKTGDKFTLLALRKYGDQFLSLLKEVEFGDYGWYVGPILDF